MGDRRELRSFAVVVLLIGVVCATAFVSCGSGGGGGDSNGDLCQQCGDTDGPCNAAGATLSGDDRPSGCTTDPCTVALRCTRKVDSGQRRCFPVNPDGQLDFRYECDGSRPIESFAPTTTPLPTVTLTPIVTATPASTEPTATGPTPSATGPTPSAASPTPEITATPDSSDNEIDVTINIDTNEDELPPFTATVSYTAAKGNFTPLNCDDSGDGIVAQDSGSGILTLTFASNPDGFAAASTTCVFHQIPGQTLVDGDLHASVNPSTVTISIDEL